MSEKKKTPKKVTKKADQLKTKVGVDARREEVAAKIGANPNAIGSVKLDIDTMRQHGILLDLDVHGLSMLRGRASWSELGIPEGAVRRKRLRRGSKDLFPGYSNRFDSLAARFRQTLEKHSRVLEGFKPYRWLPYTQYDDFKKAWGELQVEWAELKDEFLKNHSGLAIQNAVDLELIAREVWNDLAQIGENGVKVLEFDGETFESVEDFSDHMLQTYDKLPAVEDLAAGLFVDYRTAFVLGGSDLDAERARSAELQAEAARAAAKHARAEAERAEFEQAVWKHQQLAEAAVKEAEQEAAMRLDFEQRKLQAMHEAELERAREQIAQTISPIQEYLDQVLADVYQDVKGIIASIEKNGHIRGNVAEQARGLHAIYKVWSMPGIAENAGLDAALADLSSLLSERPGGSEVIGKGKYDTAAVLSQLHALSDMTHDAAVDVARRASTPTRAGALEL